MVLYSSVVTIVFIGCSINTFINIHTADIQLPHHYTMEPTPSDSSPAQSSSLAQSSPPAPRSSSVESLSFSGSTTIRREDHLQWICQSMSCNTVNSHALDQESKSIGATDPEDNSSLPSRRLFSAPGPSGSSDAVGTNGDAGTMSTDDGSEASHMERGFEDGQSLDGDDEDSEYLEEEPNSEDPESSDR
ncbi:hypothetical protein FNAPI_3791 [Fusarium napiforme]|uniref:Uncharacterized protein n=1 Tax=Fusarium napiforme TaxID=42672 RepID=A0A8H5JSY4_9HYPO|nr:hypothetical protein FNAPI_3791 [Fusarium napiforme]